jgi:choline dehydrogenase-like flavoprotein
VARLVSILAMNLSSSIKGMVYVHSNPLDYDTGAQFGNPGWSYESVLRYFKIWADLSG